MSDDIIGPALPPSFRKSSNDDSDEEDTLVGPALPPGYSARDLSSSSEDSDKEEVVFKRGRPSAGREESRDGPTAKKLCMVEEKDSRDYAVEDDDGFFGPALPPGYEKKQSSPERCPVLGPALPPGFQRPAEDEDDDDDDDDDRDSEGFPGPALPPGYRAEASSSDDDIIGPLPSKGGVQNTVAMDFERRAQKMKKKLISGDDGPVELARETWMTELPPELQHIGLGARTFKKRSGPENKDRSIWTDTPSDRQRKAQERLEGKQGGEEEEKKKKKEEELPRIPQKDLQMAEKVSKYNDMKRSESLISMHSKKMKKRAEEKAEEKPAERRPFDRDNDLQVNRFDEAQKKSLLKKSQELNTRFSHSKERMFL